MTKNTKTKRNLTWKLDELPSAGELADLVETQVITKEEAREIMFGSPESDKDKIKALEDQIEMLLGLVKTLSQRTTSIIKVPYIYTPTYEPTRPYFEKYWLKTNQVLSDSGYSLTSKSLDDGGYTMSVKTLR